MPQARIDQTKRLRDAFEPSLLAFVMRAADAAQQIPKRDYPDAQTDGLVGIVRMRFVWTTAGG